jgi:Protein of unknown function (DUF3099)
MGDGPALLFVQPVQHRALVEHAYEHKPSGHRAPVRRAGRGSSGSARPTFEQAAFEQAAFERAPAGHPTLVTGNDPDPDGPAGPQPTRLDKRWYFALMGTCIGLFVLSWAVIDRYSGLAAVIVSAVALVIPPFAVIVANVASATDRRRR